MKNILFISTGGTFNKSYSEISGNLEIDTQAKALSQIATRWRCEFQVQTIIGKDSLDMNDDDRQNLLDTINNSDYEKVIIIHGTDTMDKSAEYIASFDISKQIVFTGAMIPYTIDPIEATANLSAAFGYIQGIDADGVYISMNGVIDTYDKVIKNRKIGKFELVNMI